MARFYVLDFKQGNLEDGSPAFPVPFQKEISQDEAVVESQKSFDGFVELEKTYPSIISEYEALDVKCVELAEKIPSLTLANSPKLKQANAELAELVRRRDRLKSEYTRQREEILATLERFSTPFISETLASWLEKRKKIHGELKVGEIKKIIYLSGHKFKVVTNRGTIFKAIEVVLKAEGDLWNFRHSSLQTILDFVSEKERIFGEFDFKSLKEEEELVEGIDLKNMKTINSEKTLLATSLETLEAGQLGESEKIDREIKRILKSKPIVSYEI